MLVWWYIKSIAMSTSMASCRQAATGLAISFPCHQSAMMGSPNTAIYMQWWLLSSSNTTNWPRLANKYSTAVWLQNTHIIHNIYYYAVLWLVFIWSLYPADSWNIPMQKQFTWSPQSDHPPTRSCCITHLPSMDNLKISIFHVSSI